MANGVLEAADESDAIGVLQKQGFFILSIGAEKAGAKKDLPSMLSGGGVGGRDLMFFSGQLATLLNGGIPLMRTLSLLGERSKNPVLRKVLAQVSKDVAGGSSLHKAMARHPAVFNTMWISLIQAGEMSGQLPRALKQICAYTASQEDLKSKVLTALAYPAVLFVISMGVLGFFIIKIVPTFAQIFVSFGLKLPVMTQVIIYGSGLVTHNLPLLLVGLAGLVLTAKGALLTDAGRLAKSKLQLSVPVFGEFVENILLERLLTTLSTLISSGVSILSAISVQ
jgi:type IV pilus assembly protein PilC